MAKPAYKTSVPRMTAAPVNTTHAFAQADAAGDQTCFWPDIFTTLLPYWDRIRMQLYCPMHNIANSIHDVYTGVCNSGSKAFTAARR
jgi:hypothetical protein